MRYQIGAQLYDALGSRGLGCVRSDENLRDHSMTAVISVISQRTVCTRVRLCRYTLTTDLRSDAPDAVMHLDERVIFSSEMVSMPWRTRCMSVFCGCSRAACLVICIAGMKRIWSREGHSQTTSRSCATNPGCRQPPTHCAPRPFCDRTENPATLETCWKSDQGLYLLIVPLPPINYDTRHMRVLLTAAEPSRVEQAASRNRLHQAL